MDLLEKVKNLPQVPGIYKYFDTSGELLYVGKAKNLRSRVKSYFQGNLDLSSKTQALVSRINDVQYIEAQSELEALILEAELIKKHLPKYNINLKDDKSYLYIVIRPEKMEFISRNQIDSIATSESQKVNLPRLLVCRKSDLKIDDITYGPFPDSSTTKYVVRTIRKVFPYRDCSAAKFNRYNKLKSPCLYGHLGLCSAPCVSLDNVEKHKTDISKIKRLLSGEGVLMLKELEAKMKQFAAEERFEEAAAIRNVLDKFEYVRQHFETAQTYIENPYLVDDMVSKSLADLQVAVPDLKVIPSRIECYDISNISGKEAVGAMTVALEGRIQNSEYRKFKIKFKSSPDDFEMMREVLFRRLERETNPTKTKPSWGKPDLLVIDGGKGQVSAVLEVMTVLNLDIPVIGLAKKFETIVIKGPQGFTETVLDRSNEGLKLIQRLRDEAHRFGKKYHHELRLKKIK